MCMTEVCLWENVILAGNRKLLDPQSKEKNLKVKRGKEILKSLGIEGDVKRWDCILGYET